jgi:vanillate O-demethylase ferredoxin subunit
MAFKDELEQSAFAGRLAFHLDDGEVEQRFDPAATLAAQDPDTHLYVCGPAGFIDAIVNAAGLQGWPAARIHVEFFAAPQSASGADQAFQVRVASSGEIIVVGADETVVAALRRHSIEIAVSCEQGICGTCLTRVLEGECDHRDQYLSDAEKAKHDQFTPCCSRARSAALTLDI